MRADGGESERYGGDQTEDARGIYTDALVLFGQTRQRAEPYFVERLSTLSRANALRASRVCGWSAPVRYKYWRPLLPRPPTSQIASTNSPRRPITSNSPTTLPPAPTSINHNVWKDERQVEVRQGCWRCPWQDPIALCKGRPPIPCRSCAPSPQAGQLRTASRCWRTW